MYRLVEKKFCVFKVTTTKSVNNNSLGEKRCLDLYRRGCMAVAAKNYKSDITLEQQHSKEIAKCTFRPNICSQSWSAPLAIPNAYETAVSRLRRGQEIRSRRMDLLTPRCSMKNDLKNVYFTNTFKSSKTFQVNDETKSPKSSNPLFIIEVTKDTDTDGEVATVGTIQIRKNDNIEEVISRFAVENKLSLRQIQRLQNQLIIGMNSINN